MQVVVQVFGCCFHSSPANSIAFRSAFIQCQCFCTQSHEVNFMTWCDSSSLAFCRWPIEAIRNQIFSLEYVVNPIIILVYCVTCALSLWLPSLFSITDLSAYLLVPVVRLQQDCLQASQLVNKQRRSNLTYVQMRFNTIQKYWVCFWHIVAENDTEYVQSSYGFCSNN